MDINALWNSIPADLRAMITGAAGEVAANLVAAGGYQVKKRFAPGPREAALNRAVGQALAATALAISDDPLEMDHGLDLLQGWLADEAVIGELSRIIDPQPGSELDTDALTAAFQEAGFDPDTLSRKMSFADVMTFFADAFYNATAGEDELNEPIKIGLLRELTEQTKRSLWSSERQVAIQERMLAALEKLDGDTIAAEVQDSQIVAVGKDIDLSVTQNFYLTLSKDRLALSDVEQRYLVRLYNECNELPLADAEVDDRQKPQLQRVYVDLRTKTPPPAELVWRRLAEAGVERDALETALDKLRQDSPRQMEMRTDETQKGQAHPLAMLTDQDLRKLAKALEVDPSVLTEATANLSVFDLLASRPQFVLLGDPGSGKSTLTRRLGGVLAALGREELLRELSEDDLAWAQRLHALYGRRLLPVRVVLSRWAGHMDAAQQKRDAGCADDLIDECVRLIGQAASFDGPDQKAHFVARLNAEPPTVMLLLDGLDEVADVDQRQRVLQAVHDFHRTYGNVPMLVTCRVRPYTLGEAYKLPLPDFELAPLDRPAIGHFLERWYAELTRVGLYEADAAQTAKRRLLGAIDNPSRHELTEMAGTPLLLTMMARVNYKHGLPDNRAELYENYVNQLLVEWDRTKQADPGGRETRLDRLLVENGVSLASLQRALNRLAFEVHGQDGTRDTVEIPAWKIRERLEAIHAGDAEAKAAWAVSALRIIDDRSGLIYATEQANTYVFTHRSFQEYLAARWLAAGDATAMISQMKARLDDEQWREVIFLAFGHYISVQKNYDTPLSVIDELLPREPASPQAWSRVLLLGEAYVRLLGPQRASEAVLAETARRVMEAVPPLLTAAMQNPALPARQRLDAGLLADQLGLDPPGLDDFLPKDGWFETPAGGRFKIGRYPVTNKQYRRFMEAGGYAPENEARYWSDEGREYKQKYGWTEPRFWDVDRLNKATQPVVGVSWYEANAYCAWLTERLRETGKIGHNEEVRPPSLKEWEAAVRSSHGKDYPWGSDEFDPARANTEESDLNQTTPVHMYPDGATPDGVWDLSGNVWEWTKDVDEDGWPWLKGGAWYYEGARASASARPDLGYPYDRDYDYGFRVVVVPISR